jgi:hypothetical protein
VAAAAAAAVTAAAAAAVTAAAAASDKLEAGSGFPVEDVERRQADVEDFFLTEGEFVTRFDGPRGQICGGAGRLCDCAARQWQKSSGPQDWYGFAPTLSLQSLLRMQHARPPSRDDTDKVSLPRTRSKCQKSQKLSSADVLLRAQPN